MQAGIEALRRGDRRRARRLLLQVVSEQPDNVAAWWFLGAVVDDPAQRAEALRQVLRLRPDHEEARDLLDRLERQAPRTSAAALVDDDGPVYDAQPDDAGRLAVASTLEVDPAPEGGSAADVRVAAAVVALALLAIVVAAALVWTGTAPQFLGIRGPDDAPTSVPLRLGEPACAATDDAETMLVFINNTAVTVDILRVPEQGRAQRLLTLVPGGQRGVPVEPGELVRYQVQTEAEGLTGTTSQYEVPRGVMCRVPVE